MAVLGRLLFGSSERLDLPDLLSIDSFSSADFKFLLRSFVGSTTPYILKGFDVIQPQAAVDSLDTISIQVANSVVYHPSSTAGTSSSQVLRDDEPDGEDLQAPFSCGRGHG